MELVDFATIVLDLKLNRYYYNLPENIIHVVNKDTNTNNHSDKKRKIDQASPTIVVNKDTNDGWKLKEDET